MLEIGIILVLILLNGLLAGSEAGVVAARKARLREQADSGVPGARRALATVESPVRFLSTVQVGITLIGIFSGVYGGATIAEDLATLLAKSPTLQPIARPMALGVVVVGITYLSLVIGELVPKRIALEHPEAVARRAAGPMGVLSAIASPAVRLLSLSTNLLLRPFGVGPERAESVSEEEIRSAVRLGASSGVLEAEEGQVIERVFAIADRRAGSFVIPRRDVVCLPPDADGLAVATLARAARDAYLPVSPGGLDQLLGVVSVFDLAHADGRAPGDLVAPALFIPEQANALRAIELFRQANAQIAFVADERGTIEGMLRLADLLEEVLGEAGGEGAAADPDLVRREDGSLLIDGLLPLAEFRDEIGSKPDSLFDPGVCHTVAGLVVHQLGRVPAVGDRVDVGPWRFEVLDMDGRRVDKVLAVNRDPEVVTESVAVGARRAGSIGETATQAGDAMVRTAVVLVGTAMLAAGAPAQIASVELDFNSAESAGAFAMTAGGEGMRRGSEPRAEGGRLALLDPWWRFTTSAAFDAPSADLAGEVEIRWDLTMSLGTEGMGFAWLDTGEHGESGEAPAVEHWEAPSIPASLGIGFDASNPVNQDMFRGSGNIYNRPQHEVSLHWDGMEIVKKVSPVEFRDEVPHAVRAVIAFATGGGYVSVWIDEEPVFEGYFVPSMTAYVGRAAFGGRNTDTAGSVQIDNLGVTLSKPIEAPGEPLSIIAIDHQLNDAKHPSNEAVVDFPDDTDPYGRIICTLRLDKPETRFDPWDRTAHIYVYDNEGDRHELLRYITPYHNGHFWQMDVSDFRPWLTGSKKIEQVCGTQGEGWVVTVGFDFYPGPAERYATEVVELWNGQAVIGDPDSPPAEFYVPREVPIPDGATGAAVRTVVTGHGMSPNSKNAAEFMPIWRTLSVNGESWRNELWKTDNYLNPCRPQGGTWKFDRAGWAPGDVVRPWRVDVSHLLGTGGTLSIGYELDEYVNDNRGKTWSPFHLTAGQVIFYRD